MKKFTFVLVILTLVLAACSAPVGAPKLETVQIGTNEEIVFSKLPTSASAFAEVKISTVQGINFSLDGGTMKDLPVTQTEYTLLTGLKVRLVDDQTIELSYDPEQWEVKSQ